MDNEGDTPTGEDVRGAWAFANHETYWFSPDDHRYTSFDFKGFDGWLRAELARAWDECMTAVDAACGGSHVGMVANPYRSAP